MAEHAAWWRRAAGLVLTGALLVVPTAVATAAVTAGTSAAVSVRLMANSSTAGTASTLTFSIHARTPLARARVVVVPPTGWPHVSARHLSVAAKHCWRAGSLRSTAHGMVLRGLSCPAGTTVRLRVRLHLPTTAGGYAFATTVTSGWGGHRTRTTTSLSLGVRPAGVDHLVLTPDAGAMTYGDTQSFHAYAVDRFGNRRGDVTGQTTFTMAPDGRCEGSVCGAGAHADSSSTHHQVVATLGALHGAAELLVTPRPVTVAAQPATKVYGADDPALDHRVDGLLPGDTLPGVVCAVQGAHVGVGTYPLTCQGGTNPDYVVDRYDASTLTVTPAPLVVPVTGVQTYGGTPAYRADLASAGLVNGDTDAVVGGTLSCATTATVTSHVGDYPITGCTGLDAANYTISYSYGTVSVTAAEVAVQADDQTMTAGDADPAYTYTTQPAGLHLAGVTCTASGDHTVAGTYPITCTPTTDADYTETDNLPGTLTVQPAVAVCGNSIVESGEVCDDGNTVNETSCPYGDATCNACNSTCSAVLNLTGSYCGDGQTDTAQGEVCDDGNTVDETSCPYGDATCYACNSTCSAPLNLTGSYCGDGYVDSANGEVCDDGNNVTETSCPAGQATCQVCDATCSTVLNLTG
ncbi:MAG TPA: MBG domain-containing protein [Marmoricola sp.]|nr:MBG domain-containing protein [Marmoricola sp.]